MKFLFILVVLSTALQSQAWTRNSDGNIEFTVLSYNVACLPFPKSCKKSKMRRIGEILKERRDNGTAPDVVLIQEGFVDDFQLMIENSGYTHVLKGPDVSDKHPIEKKQLDDGTGANTWKIVGSGLWVLTDLPISESAKRSFKTDDCTSWDCYSRKGVQLANIDIGGERITFMNTHMNAGKGEKKELMRGRQLLDIVQFQKDFYRPQHPLIFGGDFNLKPSRDNWFPLLESTQTLDVGEWCLSQSNCKIHADTPVDQVLENSVDHHLVSANYFSRLFPTHVERNFVEKYNGKSLSDHAGYEVQYTLITK